MSRLVISDRNKNILVKEYNIEPSIIQKINQYYLEKRKKSVKIHKDQLSLFNN